MALSVTWRLTTPARPPAMKPPGLPGLVGEPEPVFTWEELLLWPPPKCWREKFRTAPTPLAAIMASAIMEPPVWPTLTPRLAMKLSIFCDTLRKATAHRNQISTFPVTSDLLEAATCASTSASVTAKAGTHKKAASRDTSSNVKNILFFVLSPPLQG